MCPDRPAGGDRRWATGRCSKIDRQPKVQMTLRVNGEDVEVSFAPYKTLLEVLREDLDLTGTKHGCELGECGACAVLVDGQPLLSCLKLALECEGRAIETIEGLAAGPGTASAAGGVCRSRRLAVRLLHAGGPDDGQGAARPRSPIPAASGSRRRCRATCAAAPAISRSSIRSKRPRAGSTIRRQRTRAGA